MKTGDVLGPYTVVGKLGEGGMGVVYRARDSRLKREVALKVLPAAVAGDPERLARFQREGELLASLNHPNIAHVYGFEESAGVTALVMELVEGEDLSQRIARGAVPLHEALTIAKQIAAVLDAAHEQGIVHRDLKPGNVRLRPDGTVKVLDFGLAKPVPVFGVDQATLTAMSSPGAVIGTPAYMSPEQARGEVTGRETDIWAFGVVLYELLTGGSPFGRQNSADTLVQILTTTPDESKLPPATPPSVRGLVRRCLARDFRDRWRNMGDARIVIEEALAAPVDAVAGVASKPPARVPRRRALLYGAAALGLASAGLAGGYRLSRAFGGALPPSFRRLTFRRGLIRSARVAPDGATVLYGALWENERCRVYSVRVDGPESRALDLPNANLLAISRSGEVAVALGPHEAGTISYGTLARVSMAGGVPRPIVEHVKFADWSSDGQDLAIIRRVSGGDQLEYPIGKVLVAPDVKEGTGLGFARISPDGRRVAFVRFRTPVVLAGRVEIVDRSGAVTPLSGESLNVHGLTWRGNEVVYTASDDRPLFRAVLAVTPGGAPRTITRIPGNVTVWDALPGGRLVTAQTDDRSIMFAQTHGDAGERDLSWLDASWVGDLSADGKQLLFTEYGQGGGSESSVYLRGIDGSEPVRLGAGRAMALSRDGRWALCSSNNVPSPYLEVLPTGTGEPRRLPANGLSYFGAVCLPDGKRAIVSAAQAGERARLFVLDLETGKPAAITPEGLTGFAVSTDGSRIAARGPGPTRLYSLDGAAPVEAMGLDDRDDLVGWISDGLLVTRSSDPASPRGQIYRIDLATGRREPWKNIFPRDGMGIMGLSSFRATPDGQVAYTWHRALSSLYIADGLV